ncbi:MAG: nucleotide exchange factor GrpE [Burkholderiaceae bacterium]|jgi:molecular chaperone GrpE|nr:nucleotide exchange factor GrpE [Burkholderiaceae bacterium]
MSDSPSRPPEQSSESAGSSLPAESLATEAQEAAAAANAADAQAQTENLLAEIAALKAQTAELADQCLRAQAEAQNTRRRADEEIAKIRKFAVEDFAESLLPVLDSLHAALAAAGGAAATVEHLREGTEATLRQLMSALERNKVLEINPAAGDKFDPARQQAISVVPADQPAGAVVSVLQRGYLIAERVLRPALVTVSASKD